MDNGVEERLLDSQVQEVDENLEGRIYDESKKIWRVALPGILSRVASFGSIVVTQSFIGHISELDVAAYALVQTLTVRFVNGIPTAMSSATETLSGQAYGAGQHHMMGIYLQRSWIVDFITLTVLLPFFIFATPIFKLLGQDGSIADAAGYVSYWFIPFIYNFVFSLTIQMYLQAQQKNVIIAWLSIAQFVIHIPLSWLLVIKLNCGVPGAMIALSISSWLVVFGEFGYILGGWCPNTWKGFSLAALKDILPVVKLSISSGVMLRAMVQCCSSPAGCIYLKNAEVAISAFSICLNINGWEFMMSIGFLGAACVRIANELGKGDAKAAKFSIKVLVSTSVIIGLFFWILCLIFGSKLGYLFSDEKAVADSVSDLSTLLAFSILLLEICQQPLEFASVAVGAGLQSTVAIINLCCFYLIGVPIGALLGYLAHLQVKGIWIGMICGVVTQSAALCYMTWKTDWDGEVSKAKQRLNRWYLKSSEESNQNDQA